MWSSHNYSNKGRLLIKGDTLKIVGVKAAFMLLRFFSLGERKSMKREAGGEEAKKTNRVNHEESKGRSSTLWLTNKQTEKHNVNFVDRLPDLVVVKLHCSIELF